MCDRLQKKPIDIIALKGISQAQTDVQAVLLIIYSLITTLPQIRKTTESIKTHRKIKFNNFSRFHDIL